MADDTQGADPRRPADYVDRGGSAPAEAVSPALGFVGWLRWGWRQLTSMRTALVLLLILAIAAIPGSLFPQRMADPNGVTQWKTDNPDLFPILDALQLFDVYLSVWFSAIYLLLFLSLIGCVLPRVKHHLKALRTQPPRTPVRLQRLADSAAVTHDVAASPAQAAERSVELAQGQLRKLGYRVHRYDGRGQWSVSAERGYARETGNLMFHLALLGILVTVAAGGGYAYTGQRVMTEGETFVNTLLDYSSMNKGRFVGEGSLAPYAMTLDKFDVTYEPFGEAGSGQAGNFEAHVTLKEPDGSSRQESVRVNHPLSVDGDRVYLLGNGYAPTITVRNAADDVVFTGPVPFLPQDANMTSLGVLKITDGMPEQLGMVGFFYPTQVQRQDGAYASLYGDLINPVLTLDVYEGDLGIDDGTPRSVYVLDTTEMTKLTGRDTDGESIELAPGETTELPHGLGTITFDDTSPEGATDLSQSVKRFASLQIHHDASAVWVLVFSVLAVAGLLLALFVPRRRMWVKAQEEDGRMRVEYAGLARGDDPTLAGAVQSLLDAHTREMAAAGILATQADDDSATTPTLSSQASRK
ncbi:cytochrome c biogenesis protein ResB [Microbacterium sp. YY-01]|uniref:cytochrome c biogenesis protein ResB n=1 Tax=Microbacterium sp. YY-01 TaxID=3421634 RepID=UPI003D175980